MDALKAMTSTSMEFWSHFDSSAMRTLHINAILDVDQMVQAVADLASMVSPAYLPIARVDEEYICVHLWPGTAINQSPIVTIGEGSQGAAFLCSNRTTFCAALFTQYVGLFPEARRVRCIDALGGFAHFESTWPLVSEKLIALERSALGPWASREPDVDYGWSVADVGHPFAGLLDHTGKKTIQQVYDDLLQIRAGATAHLPPELVGSMITLALKLGKAIIKEDLLRFLLSEGWRELLVLNHPKLRSGRGMAEWARLIDYLHSESSMATLCDTVFSLVEPSTYTGRLNKDVEVLHNIGRELEGIGQIDNALRQYRNSAFLMAISTDDNKVSRSPLLEDIIRTSSLLCAEHPAISAARAFV